MVADNAELRFLDSLSEGQVADLTALGRSRRHAVGDRLFNEREPGDAVLVLLSGRVKLSCVTEGGREAVLGIREPGELIGEMSAIDRAPRSATATALEPVEVLALSSEAFVAYLDRTPGVALVLVQMLNRRLRDADRKRVEFGAADTTGRVSSRLVELADRFGQPTQYGVRISVPLTQEELAGWVGSSREAVSKALRALRARGWIETRRKAIVVIDLAALRRRAT